MTDDVATIMQRIGADLGRLCEKLDELSAESPSLASEATIEASAAIKAALENSVAPCVLELSAPPDGKRGQWAMRQQLSRALHGPIQGVMYMSMVKLAEPTVHRGRISEVAADIRQAWLQVSSVALERFDFFAAIASYIELWEGVLTIILSHDSPSRDILGRGDLVAESVFELIREAINNAVKHGRPRTIEIVLGVVSNGFLGLRVANDGYRWTWRRKPGFGSAIFTELTDTWSLKRGLMRNQSVRAAVFEARIAIRPAERVGNP
jgi:signal transduction histidine kinase